MSDHIIEKVKNVLNAPTPLMDGQTLRAFVERFLNDRQRYIEIDRTFSTPLYVFEEEALVARAREFRQAFESVLPDVKPYYAIKSNYHAYLIQSLTLEGFGMDVSSGFELDLALRGGSPDIIFSGPAKMPDELRLACQNSDRVTVLMDSFGEVDRLQSAAAASGVVMRAGVRLTVEEKGLWRKFGISLDELEAFVAKVQQAPNIDWCGLEFHTSWNLNPSKQTTFLARIGRTLAGLDPQVLRKIRFLDIGGGYWPKEGEWLQPSATDDGKIIQTVEPKLTEGLDHRYLPAMPIDLFAREVAASIREHIFKYVDCRIIMEPGRWICHPSMHILLKVVDQKTPEIVITDGATNAAGWDRYETDYFPVINLSRPSLKEKECLICGSLCTPHDLWGYAYFGESIAPGDLLLVPTQGAYTYSLRQHFIKPLPPTVILRHDRADRWVE